MKIHLGLSAIIIVSAGIVLFLTALPASAISYTPIVPAACRAGGSGCTLCHMGIMAMNITNFLAFAIAIPAVALLVAVGGVMLLISGGSEQMISRGKDILTKAVVGALIVLLAWLMVDTAIKILTGGEKQFIGTTVGNWFGPWNRLDPTNCPL